MPIKDFIENVYLNHILYLILPRSLLSSYLKKLAINSGFQGERKKAQWKFSVSWILYWKCAISRERPAEQC